MCINSKLNVVEIVVNERAFNSNNYIDGNYTVIRWIKICIIIMVITKVKKEAKNLALPIGTIPNVKKWVYYDRPGVTTSWNDDELQLHIMHNSIYLDTVISRYIGRGSNVDFEFVYLCE